MRQETKKEPEDVDLPARVGVGLDQENRNLGPSHAAGLDPADQGQSSEANPTQR
jgi:hypothetical protein